MRTFTVAVLAVLAASVSAGNYSCVLDPGTPFIDTRCGEGGAGGSAGPSRVISGRVVMIVSARAAAPCLRPTAPPPVCGPA